jgi:hypothetical protein
MIWTGSIWLRIRTSVGLLWARWWTFGFHNISRNSWVAEKLAASREGFSSLERVGKWASQSDICHISDSFVNWYWLKTCGFIPNRGMHFSLLRRIQSPSRLCNGYRGVFPWDKQSERESSHSFAFSNELYDAWSFALTSPYISVMCVCVLGWGEWASNCLPSQHLNHLTDICET